MLLTAALLGMERMDVDAVSRQGRVIGQCSQSRRLLADQSYHARTKNKCGRIGLSLW